MKIKNFWNVNIRGRNRRGLVVEHNGEHYMISTYSTMQALSRRLSWEQSEVKLNPKRILDHITEPLNIKPGKRVAE